MNVLKWLNRARVMEWTIRILEAEEASIRARMENVTPNYNGDVATGSKDPHKLDQLAIVSGDLQLARDELETVRAEIRRALNKLPNNRERLALRLYYLRGLPWPAVANALHVSVRRVLDIRKDAIEHIAPIIQEEK